MKKKGWFFVVLTLLVAVPAFFLARVIWPFSETPPPDLTLFLTIVTALECIMLGLGVSFIVFVIDRHRTRKKKFDVLDWATFISIAWILISGYPHDNNHLSVSIDLHDLVPIEILFYGTLAIAAVVVAVYWIRKTHLDE